jgi:hypothetical protein
MSVTVFDISALKTRHLILESSTVNSRLGQTVQTGLTGQCDHKSLHGAHTRCEVLEWATEDWEYCIRNNGLEGMQLKLFKLLV